MSGRRSRSEERRRGWRRKSSLLTHAGGSHCSFASFPTLTSSLLPPFSFLSTRPSSLLMLRILLLVSLLTLLLADPALPCVPPPAPPPPPASSSSSSSCLSASLHLHRAYVAYAASAHPGCHGCLWLVGALSVCASSCPARHRFARGPWRTRPEGDSGSSF